MLLALALCLMLNLARAQCKASCETCDGKNLCAFENKPGCDNSTVPCLDPCLDNAVRTKVCFASSVPDGKNCAESCVSCVRDYQCTDAMRLFGLCGVDDATVNCERQRDCLEGSAKRLCAARPNTGACHRDCGTCELADDCAVLPDEPLCIQRNATTLPPLTCGNKCVHSGAHSAHCFDSAVPGNKTCSPERCEVCVAQFTCNAAMNDTGLCTAGGLDCVAQGGCLTGEAEKKCNVVHSGFNDSVCPCNACFSELDCSEDSPQQILGNCDEENILNCKSFYAECYVGDLLKDTCESHAFGFCTVNKNASTWQKSRCFIIAAVNIIGLIFAGWIVFKVIRCSAPKTAADQEFIKRKRHLDNMR